MVSYVIRARAAESPATRTVLTIHNVAFQWVFLAAALSAFGLGAASHTDDRLAFHGRASMLKGGIASANALTTVSPSYARSLLTPEMGQSLEGMLRAGRMRGILDGIDEDVWNPASDPASPAGKGLAKTTLILKLGLNPSRPLFAHVGRIF